jgi:hypothetical protein
MRAHGVHAAYTCAVYVRPGPGEPTDGVPDAPFRAEVT